MPIEMTPAHMETVIRRYFAACNAADYASLTSCFTPDAVHYFPQGLPDIPWRGADTIARKWIWCVENLGSRWTIEKILCSSTAPEAVIEWTHWKQKMNTALRVTNGTYSIHKRASSARYAPTTRLPQTHPYLSRN